MAFKNNIMETTSEITVEKIEKIIKETAKFHNLTFSEISIIENESVFNIKICDNESNFIIDIIFKEKVMSENDLDDQVTKIVERFV